MQENSPNWNSLTVLILKITLFLAVSAHLSSSIHLPQFFEHLTRGHWIALNKTLPEYYIWAKANSASWHDGNWIFELLLSHIETSFGEKGLIVFKIAIIFASIFSLATLFSHFSKNHFFGSILAILVAAGFFVSSDLLPSTFGLLLALLFLLFALRKGSLILLFLLAFLLANSTANAALLLFLSLFILEDRRKSLAVIILLALFAPPYFGLQILDGLYTQWNSFCWDVLLQRKAANIFDFSFAFLLLIWILIALNYIQYNKTLKFLLIFAATFSLLGLASNAYLPLALICSALLLAAVWGSNPALSLGMQLFQEKLSKLSPIGILWVLIVVCIITIKPRVQYPVSYALLPKHEVDAILERGLKLPLYHDSFVGSYLAYRFNSPAKSVLTTQQSQAFNDQARIEYLAQSLNPHFFTYFDFLAPKSVICRQSEPLCSYLAKDQNWKVVKLGSEELFGWNLFERNQ